jgi:hypothetical protein
MTAKSIGSEHAITTSLLPVSRSIDRSIVRTHPSLTRCLFLARARARVPALRFNGTSKGTRQKLRSRSARRDAPIAGSYIDEEAGVPVCVIGVVGLDGELVCLSSMTMGGGHGRDRRIAGRRGVNPGVGAGALGLLKSSVMNTYRDLCRRLLLDAEIPMGAALFYWNGMLLSLE